MFIFYVKVKTVKKVLYTTLLVVSLPFLLGACAQSVPTTFHDPEMDFASVKSVAVMPFENLTRDNQAAERFRTVFINHLLASGGLYVIPVGEVSRGIARAGMQSPATPSAEDIAKFALVVKVEAVITGTLKEYEILRSGSAQAGVVSATLQMIEAQTGRVVWTASSTKGGISTMDRLLVGGGRPMDDLSEQAADELLSELFK